MTAKIPESISITPKKQKPPNSPVGAGPWCRNETDGLGNVSDASTTRTGMQSNQNGMRTTAKTRKTVSKTSNKPKAPNSPIGPKMWCQGEGNGSGSHVDGSNVCRDMQHIETDMKMAKNTSRNVKMRQRRSRRLNLPCRVEIKMAEHPERWKHVSNKGNNGHALQITLIESLDTRIRKFVFG